MSGRTMSSASEMSGASGDSGDEQIAEMSGDEWIAEMRRRDEVEMSDVERR